MTMQVSAYTGEPFDADNFFSDFGGDADGSLNETEFGWYLAMCAEGVKSRVQKVIREMNVAADQVDAQRWALDM